MKYIIGVVFLILMCGIVACGNAGGESPVVIRKKTSYLGLNMYKGSELEGAFAVKLDSVVGQSKDSLFRAITLYRYLAKFSNAIENENRISFEFLDNGFLSFTDLSKSKKIISSYIYVGDSLFVLKDGTDKVFVAIKESDDSGFYRTKSVMRKMLWSVDPAIDDTITVVEKDTITLNRALKFADIADSKSMTSPRDTLIWCNVKYIYQ